MWVATSTKGGSSLGAVETDEVKDTESSSEVELEGAEFSRRKNALTLLSAVSEVAVT